MIRTLAVVSALAIGLGLPAARGEMRSEFVFTQAPFLSCHASTLVEVDGGEILSAWFGGTREGNPDVGIWTSRRSNGKWSEPVEVAQEPEVACYNPVLFRNPDGEVWLSYKFGPSPQTWTGAIRTSPDEGRTWSPVRYLPAGLYGPIKNKPLILSNGTILAGTSVESHRAWTCWVERSEDNGKTWTKHGPIVRPGVARGIIQPTLVPLADGRIRMFVRSTRRIGRICYADSSDEGRTWTEARPTDLPNPNAGIDAVALKDGRIVLVYNHSERGRSPLNVAVSNDGGDTWNPFLRLESEPGEYSYPAVIQTSDGTVHTTYTWRRKRIKHVMIPLEDIP
ncbi:MAG: sialidase family protein [Acidobacteriota bacterium]